MRHHLQAANYLADRMALPQNTNSRINLTFRTGIIDPTADVDSPS